MDLQYNNCYFDGPVSIKAVQLVCTGVAGGSVPTATTTVTFGSSTIPVAGGPAATSHGGSQQSSRLVNNAVPTSKPTSSSSSSDPHPTSNPVGNDGGDGSSSGFSHNTQIALGIGIPLATLAVALLAWWFPCRRIRRHGE